MEMTLKNGFCEMSLDESIEISGGEVNPWLVAGVAAIGVVAIANAPVAAAVMIVVKGAAVKTAVGTALTMVGGGCVAIGSAGHAL